MRELALDDWAALAAAAKELRRAGDGEALLLDGTAGVSVPQRASAGEARLRDAATVSAGEAVVDALDRVRRLSLFTVAALDGACDAAALAVALACDHAVAGPGLRIAPADDATLLRLRIPATLVARAGDLHAHRLLLDATPLDGAALATAGLVRLADEPLATARAAAQRAPDDPAGALVRRALRAATRSTAVQAADYEAELVALL
jgi:enoyl-CoA hydratase/carnithine racemase